MINKPQKITVNKNVLKKRLSHKLAARILALLSGVNRLNTLWDLMYLNDKSDSKRISVRWMRNHYDAIGLAVGTLRELYKRIKEMATMRIMSENILINRKVKEILQLFEQDHLLDLLIAYRNQMSFHINITNIKTGMNEIKEKVVDFIVSDTGRVRDTVYQFAYDASIAGFVKRNEKHFAALISKKSPTELPNALKSKALKKFVAYLFNVHTKTAKHVESLTRILIEEFELDFDVTN